jgi:nucleotide-binding universal stress UspA family protein
VAAVKRPRRIVLGIDGSAHARRAVEFVARLTPPRGGRVECVTVLEPSRVPSMPLVPPSFRAVVAGQARALDRARATLARRALRAAMSRLRRAGWRASGEVRYGVPLEEILEAVKAARADVLALGAKGAGSRTARALLGSVADGAVKRCGTSVLIVP